MIGVRELQEGNRGKTGKVPRMKLREGEKEPQIPEDLRRHHFCTSPYTNFRIMSRNLITSHHHQERLFVILFRQTTG